MDGAPKYTRVTVRLPGVEVRDVVVLTEDAHRIHKAVFAALRRAVREPDHPVWGSPGELEQPEPAGNEE